LSAIFEKGSYRDPGGKIFYQNGRVFRGLNSSGLKRYNFIKEHKILDESIQHNFLIKTSEVKDSLIIDKNKNFECILEHKKIKFITYPYEWCFDQLKDAALHHLDFQIFLLNRDCVLIDASAYNVQFINSRPIFIDVLSLSKYEEGSYWIAHRQFCENFLNPLILSSKKEIDFNNWFRGNMEGIKTQDLNNILSLKDKLNLTVFMHVYLMDRVQRKVLKDPNKTYKKLSKKTSITKKSYKSILSQLRNAIAKMKKKNSISQWQNYSKENTYTSDEEKNKINIIEKFSKKYEFNYLADLGCNDGQYSFKSLTAGTKNVIGFDFDLNVLNVAYLFSKQKNLNFKTVFMDASNPSSNQGWNESERKGIIKRFKFDGMIALAFNHHLTIAKNVPLNESLKWLINFAPRGIIEFVPKEDETIKKMLQLREDIFEDYNEHNFRKILEAYTKIVEINKVSSSGRALYEYSTI
jgi:ribosomal protein L11 methylase PrmA